MAGTEQHYSSLALRSLDERLAPGAALQVLDLGQASGANIEFYSKFARNMFVEDLYWTITQERADGPVKAKKLAERITSIPNGTKVDLICCWDVFNYLSAGEIAEVSEFLSQYCHAETMLLALMHTKPEMPVKPLTFKIRAGCAVAWEEVSPERRPAPCYTKRFLERSLPHFSRQRSLLLRSGLEEQLYQGRGS